MINVSVDGNAHGEKKVEKLYTDQQKRINMKKFSL